MLFDPRLILGGFIAGFLSAVVWFGFAETFRPPSPFVYTAARGALIEPANHPEWQQFLLLAAVRRAEELVRLRELPDRLPNEATAPAGGNDGRLANVPPAPSDVVEDAVDDPVSPTTTGAIPVEIGAASSAELPVLRRPEDERPPALTLKPARSSALAAKPKRKFRRARLPAKPAASNPFSALFSRADDTSH